MTTRTHLMRESLRKIVSLAVHAEELMEDTDAILDYLLDIQVEVALTKRLQKMRDD